MSPAASDMISCWVSVPAPPSTVSVPSPLRQMIRSSPSPPLMVSLPLCPSSVSLPASPFSVSAPYRRSECRCHRRHCRDRDRRCHSARQSGERIVAGAAREQDLRDRGAGEVADGEDCRRRPDPGNRPVSTLDIVTWNGTRLVRAKTALAPAAVSVAISPSVSDMTSCCVSVPAPPSTVSVPSPLRQMIRSSPSPPLMVSAPLCPSSVSLPASPFSVSAPCRRSDCRRHRRHWP